MRAIRADSFITSPSWPVSTSPPLPAIDGRLDEEDVAANAGDGEAGGHAGNAVRAAASWWNFGRPSASTTAAESIDDRLG